LSYRRRLFLVWTALAVILLSACSHSSGPAARPTHAGRIVSLVPSLTEDLFAIGAGDRIVAVTQADDYPPRVKRLPAVASFSSVNDEAIARLRPDAVVGIPAQERLTMALRDAGIATVFLRDDSYDDIFTDIAALGALTGKRSAANELIRSLHAKTAQLERRLKPNRRPVRVLVVVNAKPIIAAGNRSFISTMVALSGASNAVSVNQPYPVLSDEAVLERQPDAIVTDDQTQLVGMLKQEPWRSMRAVRAGHIFVLDKRHADVFERPGPRYNEGISWLIDRIQTLH